MLRLLPTALRLAPDDLADFEQRRRTIRTLRRIETLRIHDGHLVKREVGPYRRRRNDLESPQNTRMAHNSYRNTPGPIMDEEPRRRLMSDVQPNHRHHASGITHTPSKKEQYGHIGLTAIERPSGLRGCLRERM